MACIGWSSGYELEREVSAKLLSVRQKEIDCLPKSCKGVLMIKVHYCMVNQQAVMCYIHHCSEGVIDVCSLITFLKYVKAILGYFNCFISHIASYSVFRLIDAWCCVITNSKSSIILQQFRPHFTFFTTLYFYKIEVLNALFSWCFVCHIWCP